MRVIAASPSAEVTRYRRTRFPTLAVIGAARRCYQSTCKVQLPKFLLGFCSELVQFGPAVFEICGHTDHRVLAASARRHSRVQFQQLHSCCYVTAYLNNHMSKLHEIFCTS